MLRSSLCGSAENPLLLSRERVLPHLLVGAAPSPVDAAVLLEAPEGGVVADEVVRVRDAELPAPGVARGLGEADAVRRGRARARRRRGGRGDDGAEDPELLPRQRVRPHLLLGAAPSPVGNAVLLEAPEGGVVADEVVRVREAELPATGVARGLREADAGGNGGGSLARRCRRRCCGRCARRHLCAKINAGKERDDRERMESP